MNTVLCINAVGLSGHAFEAVGDAPAAPWLAARRLGAVEGFTACHILCAPGGCDPRLAGLVRDGLRAAGCPLEPQPLELPGVQAADAWSALAGLAGEDGLVLVCRADAPLVSPELAVRLRDDHRKWHAEYSFADGYPLGFAPEWLSGRILGPLAALTAGKDLPLSRHDVVFESVKVDINAFEVETLIAPLDLRLQRIDLHCDTRQNLELCRALRPRVERFGADHDGLLASLREDQEALRTLPSYFNVQLVDQCPQACPVCPWTIRGVDVRQPGRVMDAGRFLELAGRIRAFAPESVVSVSLWGEPALHPDIARIIEGFRAYAPLKLHVETAGLGWDFAWLERFAASGAHDHVTWIVSLDASDPAAYARMRGEGAAAALAAAQRFTALFPATAYVQAVRTTLNEEELQAHYQGWKQRGARQIIQKYDHFCGRLPDLRPADIAPLDRLPCWHLKRDLAVLVDGGVPRCREQLPDAGGTLTESFGNVFEEELPVIWERLARPYREQLAGAWAGPCGTCDEYYTFNH